MIRSALSAAALAAALLSSQSASAAALLGRHVSISSDQLTLSFDLAFDPTVSISGVGNGGAVSNLSVTYPGRNFGGMAYSYDGSSKSLTLGGAGDLVFNAQLAPDYYIVFGAFADTASYDESQWVWVDQSVKPQAGGAFSGVSVSLSAFNPVVTPPPPTPGTSVPEPGSLLLAVAAMLGLAGTGRRRTRRAGIGGPIAC